MLVEQVLYKDGKFSRNKASDTLMHHSNTLVLGFGEKNVLLDEGIYESLSKQYTDADIVLCSTSGEIYDEMVIENSVSVVAIEFQKTSFKTVTLNISNFSDSFEAGKKLFSELDEKGLAYVMVLSDGSLVNGSKLVKGIGEMNIRHIPVTGGLAGDADNFDFTLVGCNGKPAQGNIVAIGFYGEHLQIGHSSLGGWDMFGPERKVTRSVENRVYEIDGKSALDTYKKYLGKYADQLPGSALLFPLFVQQSGSADRVVRTILSIDNTTNSMVFAGDIPEGSYVRFMKANFDKLIGAASDAASQVLIDFPGKPATSPKFALLISCVGRKLILGKRIEEEVEAVKDIFGQNTLFSGFYSYGEISPLLPNQHCELHNQTMTITTFYED